MLDLTVLRKTLVDLREGEGLSQAEVAKRWRTTASRISRLESGEIALTEEDALQIAGAIGTTHAQAFAEYLQQDWKILDRPGFGHISREVMWAAESTLQRLEDLENDPELKNAFLLQVRLCRNALERAARFLLSTEHPVVFLGALGVGKTTVICTLADLCKPGEKNLNHKMALQTGSGRTTICEVHIRRGSDYSIVAEPCSTEEIRQYVADFSEHLISLANPGKSRTTDGLSVSTEVERALRNMTGLTKKFPKDADGKTKTEDPAMELVQQYSSKEDLQVQVMSRLDLPRRIRTSTTFPRDSALSGLDWVSRTSGEINYGRHPDFSLPHRIEITVPSTILGSKTLDVRLIDTRGIDEPSAPRRDIQNYLDDERAVIVLCSGFKDAPSGAMLSVMQRAMDGGLAESLVQKGVLLVMPQEAEEMGVRDNSTGEIVSSADEGRDIRRDQIVTTHLSYRGLKDLQVEFFNVRSEPDHDRVRRALLTSIDQLRARHEEQVRSLISTVDRLIANKADEQAKAVFEAATRSLRVWFTTNESLPPDDCTVDRALLEEMAVLRYASSLRASVNRRGDWHNFDYWHGLGFGARRQAVALSRNQVTGLKALVEIALNDPESAELRDFFRYFQNEVESKLAQFYQDVQALGEAAFLSQLAQDDAYWNKCAARWGKGQGYKNDIRSWTGDWFSADAPRERNQFIKDEMQSRWREVMRGLASQLASAAPEDERAAA